jgi:hypothetical protein
LGNATVKTPFSIEALMALGYKMQSVSFLSRRQTAGTHLCALWELQRPRELPESSLPDLVSVLVLLSRLRDFAGDRQTTVLLVDVDLVL